MKFKLWVFVMILSLLKGFSQQKINIGNINVTPEIVDSSNFNLNGTWKIMYRTYVAENPHTYSVVPLEQQNSKLYQQRNMQGELIYGCYVHFENALYISYCPYLPSLILNPKFKKTYIDIRVKDGDYDPRLGDRKLLFVKVLCPLYSDIESQSEFSLFVVTSDIICIISNNAYTYLGRVKSMREEKGMWPKDNAGYNTINLIGSSDFEILVPEAVIKEGNFKIQVMFDIDKKEDFKYAYVENLNSSNCNDGKTSILFPEKNVMVAHNGEIFTKNLKSRIIRINGGTKSQETSWRVKWNLLPAN